MRKICDTEELKRRAKTRGLLYLQEAPAKSGNTYGLYRFNCGHEQEIQNNHVINNNFKCRVCSDEVSAKDLLKHGLVIVNERPDPENLNIKDFMILECKHIIRRPLGSAKKGNVMCRECQHSRIADKAKSNGLTLINRCEHDYRYANYIIDGCGHKIRVQIGNANRNNYNCTVCNSSYTLKPSNVYILKLTSLIDSFSFIKIGFTMDVNRRVYQLSNSFTSVEIIETLPFETGKLAEKYEWFILNKYQKYRISPHIMRDYISEGFTECFDISIINDVILDFHSEL